MRFCLGIVFVNEAHWLRLHLPVLLQAKSLDGVVLLDGSSTDDSIGAASAALLASPVQVWDIVRQPPEIIVERHLNSLMNVARDLGYESILRLDPDELMTPADIDTVARALAEGNADLLGIARVNFEKDRLHWMPQHYPDYQYRGMKLNAGLTYRGIIHEVPASDNWRNLDGPTIYHYEGLRTDTARALKHVNYGRIARGLPPLTNVDWTYDPATFAYRPHEPFTGEQPLDPFVIGATAPLGEA